MSSNNSFKNRVTYKLFAYKYIYLIFMYKEDLELSIIERLICDKTKPNQIISI